MKKQTIYIIIALLVIAAIFILPKLGNKTSFTIASTNAKGHYLSTELPPSAKTGDNVRVFIEVQNTGTAPGTIISAIYDNDDGSLFARGGADLNAGEIGYANTYNVQMPAKTWNLRVEISHYEPNTGQCGQDSLCAVHDETKLLTVSNGCATSSDTNCDGKVSDSEILSYITKWISGTVTDAQVLGGIQAWIQTP